VTVEKVQFISVVPMSESMKATIESWGGIEAKNLDEIV